MLREEAATARGINQQEEKKSDSDKTCHEVPPLDEHENRIEEHIQRRVEQVDLAEREDEPANKVPGSHTIRIVDIEGRAEKLIRVRFVRIRRHRFHRRRGGGVRYKIKVAVTLLRRC